MAEEGMEEEECGRLDLAPPPPTRPISKLNQFLWPIYNCTPLRGDFPGQKRVVARETQTQSSRSRASASLARPPHARSN